MKQKEIVTSIWDDYVETLTEKDKVVEHYLYGSAYQAANVVYKLTGNIEKLKEILEIYKEHRIRYPYSDTNVFQQESIASMNSFSIGDYKSCVVHGYNVIHACRNSKQMIPFELYAYVMVLIAYIERKSTGVYQDTLHEVNQLIRKRGDWKTRYQQLPLKVLKVFVDAGDEVFTGDKRRLLATQVKEQILTHYEEPQKAILYYGTVYTWAQKEIWGVSFHEATLRIYDENFSDEKM